MRLQINRIISNKTLANLKAASFSNVTGDDSFIMRLLTNKLLYIFILVLCAAYLTSLFASGLITEKALEAQLNLARLAARRAPSPFNSANRSAVNVKMRFDAFGVEEHNPDKRTKVEASKPISAFTLVGTLPGVGAWINVESATKLVLKSQALYGYTLEVIDPGMVLFSLEDEYYPLYLAFGAVTVKSDRSSGSRATVSAGEESTNPHITKAAFNGQDGTITRELLNELLVNPYSEISKIRMIPKDNGMVIANMAKDSMLSQLGMQRGDLLTGINGIPIKDVANLSNAISSMLSGARLDFQVQRGADDGRLGYVVK